MYKRYRYKSVRYKPSYTFLGACEVAAGHTVNTTIVGVSEYHAFVYYVISYITTRV